MSIVIAEDEVSCPTKSSISTLFTITDSDINLPFSSGFASKWVNRSCEESSPWKVERDRYYPSHKNIEEDSKLLDQNRIFNAHEQSTGQFKEFSEGIGREKVRNHLSHLHAFDSAGGGYGILQKFLDGARPPNCDQLAFIAEQKLVTGRSRKHSHGLP